MTPVGREDLDLWVVSEFARENFDLLAVGRDDSDVGLLDTALHEGVRELCVVVRCCRRGKHMHGRRRRGRKKGTNLANERSFDLVVDEWADFALASWEKVRVDKDDLPPTVTPSATQRAKETAKRTHSGSSISLNQQLAPPCPAHRPSSPSILGISRLLLATSFDPALRRSP